MKRLLVLALALALGLTASACTDSTGPGDALAGNYSLQTVNGEHLPVTFCDAGSCYDILSAEITLYSNGTYQSINRYSDGNETASGNWVLSGNNLTLIDDFDGFQSAATVSGNQLTFFVNSAAGSYTAVYSR
jgi:hypothetical protein